MGSLGALCAGRSRSYARTAATGHPDITPLRYGLALHSSARGDRGPTDAGYLSHAPASRFPQRAVESIAFEAGTRQYQTSVHDDTTKILIRLDTIITNNTQDWHRFTRVGIADLTHFAHQDICGQYPPGYLPREFGRPSTSTRTLTSPTSPHARNLRPRPPTGMFDPLPHARSEKHHPTETVQHQDPRLRHHLQLDRQRSAIPDQQRTNHHRRCRQQRLNTPARVLPAFKVRGGSEHDTTPNC